MVQLIEDNRATIEELCKKYDVSRLDVFGSAATGDFDPDHSDVDFLVEFRRTAEMTAADQYFGLLEDLQSLLHRKVDLVESGAMRNRFFIRRVNETRRLLYAA